MTTAGAVVSNTALTRFVDLNGTNWRKGVTAPTDATIGTLPSVPVLLFDAIAELASTSRSMPEDWDTNTDPVLVLRWALVNAETDADTASWTLDYTVAQLNTTGAGADKTSTQMLATTDVTTANGLAVADEYETEFILDRADADNPIAAGDMLGLEIHMTNLTEVAAMHIRDAWLRYEALD